MRVKWTAVIMVGLVAIAIITYKASKKHTPVAASGGVPRIVLVADLSEADSADACADIIRSVRAARDRGIPVQELNADSKAEVLHQYHVLTIPTVLILDDRGQVTSRFEGEDRVTVDAVRTQLAKLTK